MKFELISGLSTVLKNSVKKESSNTDKDDFTEDIENEIKEAIQQKEQEKEFKPKEGKNFILIKHLSIVQIGGVAS